MGFGLPSAIGAKVAAPEKIVVDIDGDASFSMTAMELATAHQYNIGVKVLIFNNEFQGMVEQWQGRCNPSSPSTHLPDSQTSSMRTGILTLECTTPTLSLSQKRWVPRLSNAPILKISRR